jgi:hypothetical protein
MREKKRREERTMLFFCSPQRGLLLLLLLLLGLQKTALLSTFLYVCPEPVLASTRFLL